MITVKKEYFRLMLLTLILTLAATLLICVYRSRGALQGSYENDNRVVAGLISNVIDSSFLRPITVAETISKDYTTKEILSISTEAEARAEEAYAADYLKSIRDGFGYSLVYAVSDTSKVYFNAGGITKFIDVENDPHDAWYRNFLECGREYRLEVDTDEASDWALSVFVNTAVRGENNKLLGVCGVGVDMQQLQQLLARYERIYDVKIDLVDSTGLVLVDTDSSRIQRDSIAIDNLESYSDGECYYEILPTGSRTITYLEHMGWYLVVQNAHRPSEQAVGMVMPCVVCMAVCAVICVFCCKYGIVKTDEEA